MRAPPLRQDGIVLLEGLIAILIFSLGILALVGMQSIAVKQVSDARYRSEASLLANDLIGAMWLSNRDPAALQTQFNTGGDAYADWKDKVAAALPGVAASPPTVAVDGSGLTTVTVFWLAPNEGAGTKPHQYTAIAQIK